MFESTECGTQVRATEAAQYAHERIGQSHPVQFLDCRIPLALHSPTFWVLIPRNIQWWCWVIHECKEHVIAMAEHRLLSKTWAINISSPFCVLSQWNGLGPNWALSTRKMNEVHCQAFVINLGSNMSLLLLCWCCCWGSLQDTTMTQTLDNMVVRGGWGVGNNNGVIVIGSRILKTQEDFTG